MGEREGRVGVLEAIWLRPSARSAVRSVREVAFVSGVGLEGDHAQGGRRQVTVLSRERWDAACRELGRAVDPAVRRANLLVAGVELEVRRDAVLAIGAMRLRILGETRPCELLDDAGGIGLDRALRVEARGGVFGTIEASPEGGVLRVGDRVAWL